ncbi:hypothetical protein [Flavobacterium lipolyticum]|uniref:Uncharacterized protein n=1 Tax=Flavobacterium lipolyticum TaxID=2893754 RepID=A0ABS8M524_9FLAO|nr:hypothetical protein [Flavobacterium sp. F-126]MCC9019925.1 hypothetical protein [Flavobacterium sp. F-126]
MKTKKISIVLLENISFEELILKIEKAFNVFLSVKNEKGRFVSKFDTEKFKVKVIDRYDDLDEILCDDYHTLELTFTNKESFDYITNENLIKEILKNNIKWEYGIWSPIEIGDPYRKVFPNKETEIFYRTPI